MRNIPGVDLCSVSCINLLKLAPGGIIGRLCIYTRSAIMEINKIYSKGLKKNFKLPIPIMRNSDIDTIINTPSIQSILRPICRNVVKIKKYQPINKFKN